MKQGTPFDIGEFQRIRNTRWIGHDLHYFEVIGSTNVFLKERLADGNLQSGAIAVTDFQSAGRGRLGRLWQAPAHTALLVSVLLRPAFSSAWLPMIAGLAAVEVLGDFVNVRLKWPNDVMVRGNDGEWRKVAGILVELQDAAPSQLAAIVGMGLNVNIAADDLPVAVTPATSLLVETGGVVSREALLARWLGRVEAWIASAELGTSPQPVWSSCLITLNQPVTVSGAVTVSGIAEGTDEWGRLLVRDAAGVLHVCSAGDVSLRTVVE